MKKEELKLTIPELIEILENCKTAGFYIKKFNMSRPTVEVEAKDGWRQYMLTNELNINITLDK